MNIFWYDWLGYLGVGLVLLAFFLLQARRLRGHGVVYQLMNLAGALCVMISLLAGAGASTGTGARTEPMNWPVFLMQLVWIAISVFGIVYSQRSRRGRAVDDPSSPTDRFDRPTDREQR